MKNRACLGLIRQIHSAFLNCGQEAVMRLNSDFIQYLRKKIMQFPMGLPGFLDQVCEVIIAGFVVIIQQEMVQLL